MDKPQLSQDDVEASEKLVAQDGKIEIRPPSIATPLNGDTRIDLVEVRQAFVGMGKEELMKFANDPFWVRLRWSLFVFFVLLWFGMLGGAIAIIAYAPKCSAPEERQWFEKSPLYSLNADQIKDSNGNDLPLADGLLLLKDHLQNFGIKSLLLDVDLEDSEDFKSLPKKYGSQESLKKALSTLREADIHTFLKIVPNHASVNHPWFAKSVQKEDPYTSYFVWARGKDANSNTPETNFPNNWISYDGGPAWEWNSNRSEFYLHQANASYADFNFRNKEVVDYFADLYKFWLDFGFCGLHLEKLVFLVEDEELRDELTSSLNLGNLGDYKFLTHANTAETEESYELIKKWADVIANNSGVLSVDEISETSVTEPIKFVQRPFVLEKGVTSLQDQLKSYIEKLTVKPYQTWAVDTANSAEMSIQTKVALNILFMLLPRTSVVPAGIELGQLPGEPIRLPISAIGETGTASRANSSTEFSIQAFRKIAGLRESPSIELGKMSFVDGKSSALLLSRLKDGNPGVLIALNLDQPEQYITISELIEQQLGESFRIVAASKTFEEANADKLSTVLDNSAISLPTESFAVLEFVRAS